MHKKSNLFFLPLLLILFCATGCVTIKTSGQATANSVGGVFVSGDKGLTWKSKSLIPTVSGKPQSFVGLDVMSMEMDPSDNKAVYFGSIGSGLLFTYNGGETWDIAKGLGNNTIRSIAIDPKSKCTIYLAVLNKVYRSQDCTRTWTQIYIDKPNVTIDDIAVDHYNSSVIYISISRGDLVKSEDRGVSWQTVERFNDRIRQIMIDPNDSRMVCLATEKRGVFFSTDGGAKWQDYNKALKDNKLNLNVKKIEFVKKEPETIFLTATNGIIRSKDKGKSWEKVDLITSEKDSNINDFAVNQNDSKEMYYVTNTNFYNSADNGITWKPFKLPTDRGGVAILLDQNNANAVYLGVRSYAKK